MDVDEYGLCPVIPLIDKIESDGFILFTSYEGSIERLSLVTNTVIGCEKQHPFMKNIVESIDIGEARGLTGLAILIRLDK